MARKVAGYVLPPEAANAAAPQTFPGFPGVYVPGEPVAVADLGLDETQADALVSILGLPLQKVEMSANRTKAPDETPAAESGESGGDQ